MKVARASDSGFQPLANFSNQVSDTIAGPALTALRGSEYFLFGSAALRI